MQNLNNILHQFQIYGDFLSSQEYGNGHINDSYAVVFSQSGAKIRYLLQRVNRYVFQNPKQVMENLEKVVSHIRQKLLSLQKDGVSRKVLSWVPTNEGMSYYKDREENYWRVFLFIENSYTQEAIKNPEDAYKVARAFGNFQNMLSDLSPKSFHKTIPDFHHTPRYFESLQITISEDRKNRAKSAREEIEFICQKSPLLGTLIELKKRGEIPERIVHNDTKINNLLLDQKTNECLCVVDLDTVMPGLSLYDFGDMTRAASYQQKLELPIFQGLVKGYLEALGNTLNRAEKEKLAFSPLIISLELAIRFLTDYLQGDLYFKTKAPEENLERCRSQLKLASYFQEKQKEMQRIVCQF